jgi:hypothetical protein
MTEEEALRRMYNLVAVGKPWRQRPDYCRPRRAAAPVYAGAAGEGAMSEIAGVLAAAGEMHDDAESMPRLERRLRSWPARIGT